ncbi:MAG: DUF2950 domain-containing protein [Pyrinomonadaceae bacterium]|nr:DUF2950 domain-containing protein [Pyrinomonadaceae bacterium]
MKRQSTKLKRTVLFCLTYGLVVPTILPLVLRAAPQAASKKSATAQVKPKGFATPQQAAEALVQAAEQYDVAALEVILGPDGRDIIVTGEPARDKEMAGQFAAQARKKMGVSIDSRNKNRAILSVGDDDWPLPTPIVKLGSKWSFDAKAGRRELLYRRIGRNELDAIEICRGFVEAQHEYALDKRADSGVNQYAQRIVSTPGKQDGLAWRNADGSWGGPVGEEIAGVIARGYTSRSEPYHGYYFKVLKGQGPAAPLGQMDFLVNGLMIGGFALVAAPAQYQVTGVKTFMVSHDGVVYQKDLGPNTLEIAKKIERFNPDRTWTPVEEQ